MLYQVPDAGIAALREEFSVGNLRSMQEVLARCTVEHVATGGALEGFNFRGMVKNLRGMGKLEIGEVRLVTLLTRHNAFLLSNLIAEELFDHVKGFMDLYLGDRAILNDAGKRRFLYKVPSAQLERLRTIVNQNQLAAATGFPFHTLDQFKKRLGACTVDGGRFDVRAFAESVKVVSNVYEDGNNNQYHHVVAGEMEYPYLIYVNPKTRIPDAITLFFGATPLALVRD